MEKITRQSWYNRVIYETNCMIWPCNDLSLSDTYFLYREDQQDQHHRHIEAAMNSWEHLSRNSVALYQPYMCSVNKP